MAGTTFFEAELEELQSKEKASISVGSAGNQVILTVDGKQYLLDLDTSRDFVDNALSLRTYLNYEARQAQLPFKTHQAPRRDR